MSHQLDYITHYPAAEIHKEYPSIFSPSAFSFREIYQDERVKLINGDSTDSELFNQEFIDLTVTSPPYNVDIQYGKHQDDMGYEDYLKFSKAWLTNLFNWTKPTGRLCLNIPLDKNKGGQQSVGADFTQLAKKIGWQYHSTIIWNEGNISRRTAWGSWMSASAPYVIAPVELIIILYKETWKKNHKGISDITKNEFMDWTNGLWSFNGESAKRIGHPAPFPKELPYRCIKLFSFVDDCVFDPFLGSGTTGVVAQNHQRNFVGVEVDKQYFQLAQKRIQQTKGFNV